MFIALLTWGVLAANCELLRLSEVPLLRKPLIKDRSSARTEASQTDKVQVNVVWCLAKACSVCCDSTVAAA